MYPFQDDMYAPRNRWYVAAWAEEVSRTPIERWILDAPIAMYRTQDGTAVALDGRCPHHLFPLGKSTSVGDDLRCAYHGLTFSPDGLCVAAPFLRTIPSACRIKAYPVREKWKWIWLWPGNPELADDRLIPDHFEIKLTDPAFQSEPGLHLEIDARYQLINDNLLDLTHLEVLHSSGIGESGIGHVVEESAAGTGWVSSYRSLSNVSIPKAFQPFLGDRPVDRRFGLQWDLPGLHHGYDMFSVPTGELRAGEPIGRLNVFHAVTPARLNTCHYFSATSRNFAMNDEAMSAMFKEVVRATLAEDVFAAVEIEKQLCADSSASEMLFRSDATVVKGRRMMEDMMAVELPRSKPQTS